MNLYCCKLRRVLCFGRPVGLELPKYADMTEKEDENERERERRRKTEICFKIRMYESIIKSFFLSIIIVCAAQLGVHGGDKLISSRSTFLIKRSLKHPL